MDQPCDKVSPKIWNHHNLSSSWGAALNLLQVLPQETRFIYPDISQPIWLRHISSVASADPWESTKLSNIPLSAGHA